MKEQGQQFVIAYTYDGIENDLPKSKIVTAIDVHSACDEARQQIIRELTVPQAESLRIIGAASLRRIAINTKLEQLRKETLLDE